MDDIFEHIIFSTCIMLSTCRSTISCWIGVMNCGHAMLLWTRIVSTFS